jgi:indole-3-glycerol phosphate synthase
VIAHVDGADAARTAERAGAEALFVGSGLDAGLSAIRAETELPILVRYDGQQSSVLAGADACLVDMGEASGLAIEDVHRELGDEFELAPRIANDGDLEFLLEQLDPEIFVLAAERGDDDKESALDRVLELLPDVPAGKLAIADIGVQTREEVEELERAGVDGVIVAQSNIAHLVGVAPPEV